MSTLPKIVYLGGSPYMHNGSGLEALPHRVGGVPIQEVVEAQEKAVVREEKRQEKQEAKEAKSEMDEIMSSLARVSLKLKGSRR